MVREICRDVIFLGKKSEPATKEDLSVAKRFIRYTCSKPRTLRRHGGKYDWDQ